MASGWAPDVLHPLCWTQLYIWLPLKYLLSLWVDINLNPDFAIGFHLTSFWVNRAYGYIEGLISLKFILLVFHVRTLVPLIYTEGSFSECSITNGLPQINTGIPDHVIRFEKVSIIELQGQSIACGPGVGQVEK